MTKIMSWNIENFDSLKITSNIQANYVAWGTGLRAYITTNPTATPLDLINQAVTTFPVYSYENQYQAYYTAVIVAATNLAVAATPAGNATAYETAFNASLAASFATFPLPNKWPMASFTNGLAAIAATGTVFDVLYKIFELFFITTGTSGFSNLPVILANLILLQTNPNLKAEVSEIKREIARQGTASAQLYSFNHIKANINPAPAGTLLPDIIVVMEVLSGTAVPPFQSIDGNGQSGILELLTVLRTFNPNYCLIPPVRMGKSNNDKESIAVFYNANLLQFEGPYIWNGTSAVAPAPLAVPAGYGGNWESAVYPAVLPPAPGVVAGNALPDRNVTVAGTVYKEYQLAGQCTFPNAGATLNFMGPTDRPPFLTDFLEIASGRRIRLCSMHPNRGAAGTRNAPLSVANMANIAEISAASIVGNMIGVIVGDFNTQLLNPPTKTTSYTALTAALPFKLVFDDTFVTAPTPDQYLGTTLNDLGPTTFANTFPGYGYLKQLNVGGGIFIYESLDNILVNPVATVYTNAMILNRVVGVSAANASTNASSPLTPTTYGYGTASILTTGLASSPYGCLMGDTIEDINAMPVTMPVKSIALNSMENYGKIRATSDHMALVITV